MLLGHVQQFATVFCQLSVCVKVVAVIPVCSQLVFEPALHMFEREKEMDLFE